MKFIKLVDVSIFLCIIYIRGDVIMRKQDLISEFEVNNDFYRVYELDENDSDYVRIVSESKKGRYLESTKKVKKILGLNIEK